MVLPTIRAFSYICGTEGTLLCGRGAKRAFFAGLQWRQIVETPFWADGDSKSCDVHEVLTAIEGCDTLISLVPWHSESVSTLLALLRPQCSVGFNDAFIKPLCWNRKRHICDISFDVVRLFAPDLRLQEFSYPLSLDPDYEKIAARILSEVPPEMNLLTVHFETREDKMWSGSKSAECLKDFLAANLNFFVLVLGKTRSNLSELIRHPRIVYCSDLPLGVSFALLKRTTLFLGVDSCMLHFADLQRLPGVALFGPTDPDVYGFRFSRFTSTITGKGSMDDIGVDEVCQALQRLVKSGRN